MPDSVGAGEGQPPHRLEIVAAPDGLAAILADGTARQLTENGAWLAELGEGWAPAFLLCGLGEVAALALRHRDGAGACWYLDRGFAVIAHGFDGLSPSLQDGARAAARALIDTALAVVLRDAASNVAPCLALLELDRGTLALLCPPAEAPPSPPPILLSGLRFGQRLAEPGHDGAPVPLSGPALAGLARQIMLELAPAAARDGCLTLPSPVDGQPVGTDVCFVLSHFVLGYRFVDRRFGLPYVVIATMHVCQILAVWFPISGSCYVRDAAALDYLLRHHPGRPVDRCITGHVRDWLAPLLRALRPARPLRPAFLFLHKHLGHHLWQDLSGLAAMMTRIPEASMPEIIVLNAGASEMFGGIDALYPCLRERVDRRFLGDADLCAHVYEAGLCLLSPAGCRITADLAGRIVGLAEQDPATSQDHADRQALDAAGIPVVLIGFRLENRTIADFQAFALELVALLLAETGDRIAIVLDGHNRGRHGSFESHGQQPGCADLALAEQAVAEAIRAAVAGRATRIIDTIGAPMARSVFWSRHADFFVTPWGAGLAKYRWIGNRPGLVLAGRGFQEAVSDIGIYDDPRYREAPTPQIVLDPRFVEDRPDSAGLVPIDDPSRVNFSVDMDAVRVELRRLLAGLETAP